MQNALLVRERAAGQFSGVMPNALLLLTVAYVLTFDFLPDAKPVFSAVLPAVLLATVIIDFAANLAQDQLKAILFVSGFVACPLLWQFVGNPVDWGTLQRYVLAIAGICIAIFVRGSTLRVLAPICGSVVIAVAGAVGIWRGGVIFAGSSRFAPFTGGELAVHSSALAVTASVILILASKPLKSRWGFIAAIGVTEVIAYGTAGEMISCIIVMVGFANSHGAIPIKRIAGWASPIIAYAAFWHESQSVAQAAANSSAAIGSGRVGAWQERLDIALHRGLEFNLFGEGPGSDLRFTEVWWWQAKNAHSDLLTLFMEFGVLGLVMTILLIVQLARSVGARGRVALAAALVGAVISNALLDRPVQALLFGLAIASTANRGRTEDDTSAGVVDTLVHEHSLFEAAHTNCNYSDSELP